MYTQYYVNQNNLEIQSTLNVFSHNECIKTSEAWPAGIVHVFTVQREPQVMQWGFNCLGEKERIFNVQIETVIENPMFQKSMRESRCLVPVSWYFKLKDIGAATKKNHSVNLPGQSIFYIAGIYQKQKGEDLPAFAILTREASSSIDGRMPVILHKVLKPLWLHGSNPQKLFDFAEQSIPSELQCD